MRWSALALCLCLAPALARAQIDNSALECGSQPTYFPRGDHWPMVPPADDNRILFLQQQDGAPDITNGDDFQAVLLGFAEWMNYACTPTAYPNVFIDDGARVGQPRYATKDRGDTFDASGNLVSSNNIVYFATSDWDEIADPMTVALSTNLFIPDTGLIVTSDMEFNAVNFHWRAAGSGCSTSDPYCYDIQSVTLHEVGHFLGFNHVMCADAVMFPQGSGTAVRHELSQHEQTGLCAVYPPRNESVADRDRGEQCASTSQCPAGDICIKPAGMAASAPWGWCAKPCSVTSDCPTAFICAQQDGGSLRFCKPGVHDTGTTGGVVDPATGESYDLCAPCTAGTQCASGVCISSEPGDAAGICTQVCAAGLPDSDTGSGCPDGMTCTPTDQGWSVCWPIAEDSCGSRDYGAGINELCYREQGQPNDASDDWFAPCGPDLICFPFKPRAVGQEGACVTYCNEELPCPEYSGLSCCFGVDDSGSCLGPASNRTHGGCFDMRRAGESCVLAEQSICEQGTACYAFTQAAFAKCHNTCFASDSECAGSETCMTFTDGGGGLHSVCCDTATWSQGTNECVPGADLQYYDLGVECRENADCDSGLCLKYGGKAACSRPCNAVTGFGCPEDVDVDGDGRVDPFRCITAGPDEYRCWPLDGPLPPPVIREPPAADEPGGGCCTSSATRPGDTLLNGLAWLPLLWLRLRRRRC